jgi:LacI family transcriptional regulator
MIDHPVRLIYLCRALPRLSMSNLVTITHIAQAAGVSTATVDRVLNNRPGVNAATVQKVRDAVAALGAAPPARGRPRLVTPNYKFAFVLPANRRGFFDMVDRVIAQAAGDFRHQHITQVTHRLSTTHARDFASELGDLSDFDGIALLAPDTPPVKLAVNALVRSGVHVVTLFSDVPGSMRETFIGADNRAAGRTAGLLSGGRCRASRPAGARCSRRRRATRPRSIAASASSRRSRSASRTPRCCGSTTCPKRRTMPTSLRARPCATRPSAGACTPSTTWAPGHGASRVRSRSWSTTRRLCFAAHDLLETHRTMLVGDTLSYVLHQDVFYA